MSLGGFIDSVVSRIVREEPVCISELQGAGRALLSKEETGGSREEIAAKVQGVVAQHAHVMKLQMSGREVAMGECCFRVINPELRNELDVVIWNALIKKMEEDVGTYRCGGRTFRARDVEKKCSYYGMEGCDCDGINRAYRELLALRKKDQDAEYKRLVTPGSKFDKVFRKRIDQVKRLPVDRFGDYDELMNYMANKEVVVALGHAMEISERFKDKYYTLIHGESAGFVLQHIVAKKLEQIVGKDFWRKNYVFRHDRFRRAVKSEAERDDRFWTKILSDQGFDAAAYFCRSAGVDKSMDLVKTMVEDVFSPEVASSILKKLNQLNEAISLYVKGHGSFCVLCVPKDKMLDCLARPVWVGGIDKLEDFEAAQNDKGRFGFHVGEVVLAIDKMTPEHGVLSFYESGCLTEEGIERINDCVHEIINAAIKGKDVDKVAIPF